MSLRIRRGTDAQRQGVVFDLGEPVWTTDTKQFFIGDGISAGGTNILANSAGVGLVWNNSTLKFDATGGGGGGGGGITAIVQDTNPTLGGNLTLGGHNISGTGNISITGSLSTSGTASFTGGLGANLNLNSNNISGTGSIGITGNITSGATLSSSKLSITTLANASFGAVLTAAEFQACRGTVASPTTVLPGDTLSTIRFAAYDSTATYNSLVGIHASVSYNSIGSYATPGQLNFAVKDDSGVLQTYVILLSNGILSSVALQARGVSTTVKNTFITKAGTASLLYGTILFDTTLGRLQVYDTTGWKNVLTSGEPIEAANYATDSYPNNPTKGMIIFDSTLNHFYGYNGTSWVAFTGP